MAAVEVTISGTLYDKNSRVGTPVTLIGEAIVTGLGVGGGPIVPPPQPPGIWGPTDPRPTPPIANVPGVPGYRPPGDHIWGGGNEPFPTPPIHIPPLPPNVEQPQPGDPTKPLPPPPGAGGWPVQPQTPPPYIVVNYPGIGPVIVAPPTQAAPQ